MPNFGPLVTANLVPVDLFAPGAGILTAIQDNRSIKFRFELPAVDADGGALTGLTKVTVGVAPADEQGNNPFVDVATFAQVATTVVEIKVDDTTGSFVEGTLPVLAYGKLHYLAAFSEDDGV